MSERRKERVLLCLEPTLARILFNEAIRDGNITSSEYVRKMLIKQWREMGLLNDRLMEKIFVG